MILLVLRQNSLFRFILRYHRFSITIFGVLLIAMCHAMSENYLIHLAFKEAGTSGRPCLSPVFPLSRRFISQCCFNFAATVFCSHPFTIMQRKAGCLKYRHSDRRYGKDGCFLPSANSKMHLAAGEKTGVHKKKLKTQDYAKRIFYGTL